MIEDVPETFFWHLATNPDWLSNWRFELHRSAAGYYWRVTPEIGRAVYFTPVFSTESELERWKMNEIANVPPVDVVHAEWRRRVHEWKL